MATRDSQQSSVAGLAATYHAASGGGDKVPPGCLLHVKNGSGSSINLTLATPGTAYGQPIGDQVVAVPAGAERFVSVPSEGFTDMADGLVSLAWSAVTTVTFAVVRP